MARQVTLHIQPKGSSAPLTEFTYVRIFQDLHTHHSFEIGVPFDYLEGRQASFMQRAHRELVGQPVTFSLTPDAQGVGQQFAFTGFVTDIVVASDNDYTGSFVIRGYGPSCLLTDGVQQRTFVKQSLNSIINQVLEPYRANLLPRALNLTSQAPLPYVVQYNESNFDFLNRLLAECHEWFYYDGTTLHFGLASDAPTVPLELHKQWSSFQLEAGIRPSQVALHGYDPTQHQHWDGKSPATPAGLSGNPFAEFAQQTSQDVFTQPLHAPTPLPPQARTDVQTAAQDAGAAVSASALLFRGRSENPDLRLGTIIDASAEALGSDNLSVGSLGKYRVVQLTHELDYTGGYVNTFSAVLHSLPQPPANPYARPQPGVPELAEVIDMADPQRLGRVRVRYYWPVAKPTSAETDWVRVLTPYAGDGKGQLFTPEVGSQVLVHYQQQRPEQPLVLGNLFHAQNKQSAKYTNPDNNLKGMQTAGGNKFVMSDAQGQQKILISNSNNKGTAVEVGFKGDGSITIKSNGPVTVLSPTITLEAGDKGSIKLHAKTITMVAEEEITASSEAKSITLKAKQNIVATATEKMELHGEQAARLTSDQRAGLTSPQTVDVGSGQTVNISASTVNQS